jgi:hypothetical protein
MLTTVYFSSPWINILIFSYLKILVFPGPCRRRITIPGNSETYESYRLNFEGKFLKVTFETPH